jgi:formamidopyrimidine-DNA glycosylase
MPEGNTVWMAARTLRRALAERILTAADVRVPSLSTIDLTGRRVMHVVPRGKHLLIRIEGDLTLHSHLRMDGSWRVYDAGRHIADEHDHVRVVLGNDVKTAVGYRVHDVALVPTSDEDSLIGHLGPDLLGPDWDAGAALDRLRSHAAALIGEALLDQRNLAGIGNVYRCEICFLRGISPWTPIGAVPDLPALVDLAHRLLSANRQRYDHVTTGDDRPGRRVYVYDRAGRPCLRCGAPIRSASQGEPPRERISYWCARCQPGPAPEQALRGFGSPQAARYRPSPAQH